MVWLMFTWLHAWLAVHGGKCTGGRGPHAPLAFREQFIPAFICIPSGDHRVWGMTLHETCIEGCGQCTTRTEFTPTNMPKNPPAIQMKHPNGTKLEMTISLQGERDNTLVCIHASSVCWLHLHVLPLLCHPLVLKQLDFYF